MWIRSKLIEILKCYIILLQDVAYVPFDMLIILEIICIKELSSVL